MFSYALERSELVERVVWLVRIRWIAVIGLFATIFVSGNVLEIVSNLRPLYCTATVLTLSNLFLSYSVKRIEDQSYPFITMLTLLQIMIDLISLTLLIHFSGGVENPFFFYFVFHVFIASILLPVKISYIQAIIATILFSYLALLEYYGVIAHYHIKGLPELYQSKVYLLGLSIAFPTTMFFSVYLASSIMLTLKEKARELEELQEQVIQHEKMVGIGQLAAGIAHEIGNPLASISSLVQLMQREADSDQTSESLNLIKTHINRISGIVRQVVDFARPAAQQWQRVQINDIVKEAVNIAKYDKRTKSIEFAVNCDDQLPPTDSMAQQLLQVFTNIILNAIDAMPDGGKLTVTTKALNESVQIDFTDTGLGMTKEQTEKAFEPFYTTKPIGKGTGLGLSVSYGIVGKHDGRIDIRSKKGKGTTFSIVIPTKETIASAD